MKKLFALTSNNGDGSSSTHATFDAMLIEKMQEAENDGSLDFERWSDGDCFYYETWTLPEECTPENVGISPLVEADVFY